MALYHKHRPQLFSTIIGQEPIVTTLRNQVQRNRLAHAYVFSGPRGVGKTTSARVLAKAINCANRGAHAEPCDACQSCQEISGSRSIDVIEMDAASHTGVDNVREHIIDNAQFQPTASPYKIFIIDEVHMLSTSAFNALLKILEEPPAHVLFILATTELQKLPDTIISRCQRFAFKKIPHDILQKHLQDILKDEGATMDPEVLERIIRKSDGCARDAVSLLDQVMAIGGETHITVELASLALPIGSMDDAAAYVQALVGKDIAAALLSIGAVVNSGGNIIQFAADTIELLRTLLLLGLGVAQDAQTFSMSDTMKATLADAHKLIASPELVRLIDIVMKRRAEIKSSPLPQLPLELAAIEWCSNEIQPHNSEILHPAIASPTHTDEIRTSIKKEEEPEKKTIIERVKEFVTPNPAVSIDQVRSVWDDVLKKVEQESPSLVFILKMTELCGIHGGTLALKVPYRFHRDTLTKKTCAHRLEEILSEHVGARLQIDVEVAENPAASAADVQEMAAVFGGEVIG